MTATELREWLIERFKSQMPPAVPNDVFSQADCDLLNQWLNGQIESRITLEVCEKLAAIHDRDGFDAFVEAWSPLALQIMSEIETEIRDNIAGSDATVPGYVDMRKFRLWLENPMRSKRPQ